MSARDGADVRAMTPGVVGQAAGHGRPVAAAMPWLAIPLPKQAPCQLRWANVASHFFTRRTYGLNTQHALSEKEPASGQPQEGDHDAISIREIPDSRPQ
jgi:hypothetical protein